MAAAQTSRVKGHRNTPVGVCHPRDNVPWFLVPGFSETSSRGGNKTGKCGEVSNETRERERERYCTNCTSPRIPFENNPIRENENFRDLRLENEQDHQFEGKKFINANLCKIEFPPPLLRNRNFHFPPRTLSISPFLPSRKRFNEDKKGNRHLQKETQLIVHGHE